MPKLRIVAIADTHGQHEGVRVPDGDIFIHAGDFMETGVEVKEITAFNSWLGRLPHRWKLVVAGNHDLLLQGSDFGRVLLTNAVYLENRPFELYGVNFFGSPYTPRIENWAFMEQRRGERLRRIWNQIPNRTDVLITHGPPWGVLDIFEGENCGCELLLERLAQHPVPIHIFGHIHPGHGQVHLDNTQFFNVAVLDAERNPTHTPTVIDIEMEGRNQSLMSLGPKEWR